MKTGNKRFIALLCAVLILVGLVGCGAEPEPVQIERVHQAVFRDNFGQILAPIASDYTITELPPVEFEEGKMYRAISLKDELLDSQYYLRMYYDTDGQIELVLVDGEKGERTNLNFAVLCLYAYEAMGFEVEDVDAFYEEFALLTPEPEGYKEVTPGVSAVVYAIDDSITFSMDYNDENAPE